MCPLFIVRGPWLFYSDCQKKRVGIQTFFSTTAYTAIPYFGTLFLR